MKNDLLNVCFPCSLFVACIDRNQHMAKWVSVYNSEVFMLDAFEPCNWEEILECTFIFAWHNSLYRLHVYSCWWIGFQMPLQKDDNLLGRRNRLNIRGCYLFGCIKCFFAVPFYYALFRVFFWDVLSWSGNKFRIYKLFNRASYWLHGRSKVHVTTWCLLLDYQ